MPDIQQLFTSPQSILPTSTLRGAGLSFARLKQLQEDNVITKVKHGYYQLVDAQQETVGDEHILATLFPDGVVCMYSALFYYGYSDRTPLAWDIAVNKDTSKARFHLDYPFVHPYYMEQAHLAYGVTTAEYPDATLQIFDRDRLICEVLRYENKMDRETYQKAIQAYVNDPNKNIAALTEYAKKRKMYKKVADRIGVWL